MTRVMDGVGRSSSVRSSSPVVARERTARPASAAAQEAQRQAAVMRLNGLGLDGMRPQLAGAATMAMPAMAASPVLPMLPALPSLPAVSRDRPAWLTKRPVLAYGLVGMAIIAAVTTSFLINRQAGVTAQADNAAGALKFPSPSASPTPAAAAQPETSQAAQDILNAFAAAHPGMYGLYVKDLSTGQVASVAADRQMTSASLYKLFVAKQIYQLIDRGQLSYSSPAGGGSGKTVDGCLTVMINVSDNTCGRALGTIVGWNKQNAALADEGFTGTSLTTPQQTSAQDVGLLLERIYTNSLNGPESNARFLALLKDQRVNNRLPVGLPRGTVIAHKTGDLDGYIHDAGIVYGPKTDYIVVVMSGAWSTPGVAPAQFVSLSSQLWNLFEN